MPSPYEIKDCNTFFASYVLGGCRIYFDVKNTAQTLTIGDVMCFHSLPRYAPPRLALPGLAEPDHAPPSRAAPGHAQALLALFSRFILKFSAWIAASTAARCCMLDGCAIGADVADKSMSILRSIADNLCSMVVAITAPIAIKLFMRYTPIVRCFCPVAMPGAGRCFMRLPLLPPANHQFPMLQFHPH